MRLDNSADVTDLVENRTARPGTLVAVVFEDGDATQNSMFAQRAGIDDSSEQLLGVVEKETAALRQVPEHLAYEVGAFESHI